MKPAQTLLMTKRRTYSIPGAQTEEDITQLVRFAKEAEAKAAIAKPLKVPIAQKAQQCKDWFRELYLDVGKSHGRIARGRSWRLPIDCEEALVLSVKEICIEEGIEFRHCKHDVANRK